ncbi:MAG: hypothetical protein QM772_10315 [Ottowia sp.]|uniref:hypothetical protein n=1 Tax=Ottowia sp. TaxID=1898956 RepID=UPI0039E56F2B
MHYRYLNIRRVLVPSLLWVGGAAWSQQPVSAPLVYADEPLPTRFVLCQREIAGQAGERQLLLRACLARRLEGERIAERNCRRQAAGVAGGAARHQAQRDCLRQALALPSGELPKAPPPAPRPVVPEASGAPAPAPAARSLPAAGEN